jgi:hypothetical protein
MMLRIGAFHDAEWDFRVMKIDAGFPLKLRPTSSSQVFRTSISGVSRYRVYRVDVLSQVTFINAPGSPTALERSVCG